MNIKEAVLATADLFEREPGRYNFTQPRIPEAMTPGMSACLLGWIGFFMGMTQPEDPDADQDMLPAVAALIVGAGDGAESRFYEAVDRIKPENTPWRDTWISSAATAAAALRELAEKIPV